jgi:hypothetical protein
MCSDGLPGAESLGNVASEATDIGSDHGDLVKTGHLQNLRDGETVLEPFGQVVWCQGQRLWSRVSNDHISYLQANEKHLCPSRQMCSW